MKMFLLGMLVMWTGLNVMVWVMDFADNDFRFTDLIRRGFPLMYVGSALIEQISGLPNLLPLLPKGIKYRINPFNTSIMTIYKQLKTAEAREEWILASRKNQQDSWRKVFKNCEKTIDKKNDTWYN